MGYKFYETAAEEGLIDYDALVQYPFGYGLSYTKFSQKMGEIQEDENGNITVNGQKSSVTEVKVLNNTGTILPTTGGNGTSLIYFLGAVLALVSGVVLITKQRMKNS